MGYGIPKGFLTLATSDDASVDANAPGPRGLASMIYDSFNRRIVLFGGGARPLHRAYNDLWEMPVAQTRTSGVRPLHPSSDKRQTTKDKRQRDEEVSISCSSWRPLHVKGTLPAPRAGAAVIYDPGHKRIVLFGGQDANDMFLSDLWILNLTPGSERWKPAATATPGPSPRCMSYCVYDPNRGSMILLGGWGPCLCSNDLWELDLESLRWRQVETSGTPAPRRDGGAVYDPKADRIVFFGGLAGPSFTSEVWVLELRGDRGTWEMAETKSLTPTPLPVGEGQQVRMRSVRGKAGFAFGCDPGRRRCYTFGGWNYPPFRYDNGVQVLDLASLRWEEIGVAGPPPVERRNPAGVFDPVNNRLVVFGGDMWPDVFFADTRILQFGGETPDWAG